MSLIKPITFLDMVQRVHMETGTSGSSPTTVVGQVDQINRLATWVSQAWQEIQSMHDDWQYLRATATWISTTGTTAYGTLACGITAQTFSKWIPESVRNYTTASGITSEIEMFEMTYEEWRALYLLGANRNTRTRPQWFAIAPDMSVCPGPINGAGYTYTGDYYISPQPLVNDSDTPTSVSASVGASGSQGEIPQKYNMACVYWAMMAYGSYESAPEIFNRAEKEFYKIIQRKRHARLPQARMGGALA